jgi:Transposase
MLIIGIDYHPSFQQIAFMDQETGEYDERRLNHSDGEAERFYRELKQRGVSVRVGMEATGYSRWFERLLAELGFEVWIGDAAEISRQRVRKQKTDREDARLLLRLLRENRFPRIWVPSPENRDLRQLLWHRHRLVQMRTRIMNQLQAVAMNEGQRWKKKLFSEQGRTQSEKLSLAPWASRRRKELLELLDQLDPKIAELTTAVEREALQRPEVLRLMTHPGVGSSPGWSTFWSSGHRSGSLVASRSAAIRGLFRVKTPVPGGNGWDISASKATRCCATCWEKQRKRRHGVTRTGGVAIVRRSHTKLNSTDIYSQCNLPPFPF